MKSKTIVKAGGAGHGEEKNECIYHCIAQTIVFYDFHEINQILIKYNIVKN